MPPSLQTLPLDAIWEEWEAREGKGKGKGEDGPREEEDQHLKGWSCGEGSGRRRHRQEKGKGREAQGWQKEWQEVGATFGLSCPRESSGLRLYEFSDSYGLDWT